MNPLPRFGMSPPARLPASLAAAAICGAATAGELLSASFPAGAISTSELSGVQAEICRNHLFDPAGTSVKLPAGYRLLRAEEVAASDATVAALLRANAVPKTHAFGSLCFVSASTFIVDGVRLSPDPMPLAFWWVAADGPLHATMRGKARWIQIGSWYPRESQRFDSITRTDPMAQFTNITVERIAPDAWRLSLALPSETVHAEVHVTSPGTPSNSTQPGYMSVPMSGDSAGFFSVYAYIGHSHRTARGSWRTTGTGTFTSSFAIQAPAGSFETVFQEGWTGHSALYRFSSQ